GKGVLVDCGASPAHAAHSLRAFRFCARFRLFLRGDQAVAVGIAPFEITIGLLQARIGEFGGADAAVAIRVEACNEAFGRWLAFAARVEIAWSLLCKARGRQGD